jgi:hypothetical protein
VFVRVRVFACVVGNPLLLFVVCFSRHLPQAAASTATAHCALCTALRTWEYAGHPRILHLAIAGSWHSDLAADPDSPLLRFHHHPCTPAWMSRPKAKFAFPSQATTYTTPTGAPPSPTHTRTSSAALHYLSLFVARAKLSSAPANCGLWASLCALSTIPAHTSCAALMLPVGMCTPAGMP